MLSQVATLGKRYSDWVVLPVDRKLRLFENPILESLTITPWYVVPIVWIPIITYFIYMGFNTYVEITKGNFNMPHYCCYSFFRKILFRMEVLVCCKRIILEFWTLSRTFPIEISPLSGTHFVSHEEFSIEITCKRNNRSLSILHNIGIKNKKFYISTL